MRFALRTKLFALTTFVVTVLMAYVTWVFTVRQQQDRRRAVEAEVQRLGQNIATLQLVEGQDWSVYQEYVSRLMDFNREVVYIAVYDERHALRAHTLNLDLVELGPDPPKSRWRQAQIVARLDRGEVARDSRDQLRVHRVNILSGDRVLGSVNLGFSLDAIHRELRAGLRRNVLVALAFVLLSGLLSFVLSRRLTGPLERLSRAMSAVADGDLEASVHPESQDEIGQLARAFNDMLEGLRERRAMDRLGRDLGGTFDVERLVRLVRERLAEAAGAAGARLFLRSPGRTGSFREEGSADRAGPALLLDPAALGGETGEGFAAGLAPAGISGRLLAAGVGERDLVVPMHAKGRLLGLVALAFAGQAEPPLGRRRRFLQSLAGQAALALENARLYEELREQERMRGELDVARAVQRRLLPRETPLLEGYLFAASCRPAFEVGGDYFDFIPLGAGRLGVVIADVSGKGASASLYMAEIKGMMLPLAALHRSPRALLAELNRRLYPTLDRRVFASMLYGVLEVETASFTFARAGHSPLLVLRRAGGAEELTPPGIAVGLDAGPLFEKTLAECAVALAPGDTLVLYTDGVTDARNERREQFGGRRLAEAARQRAGAAPATLVEQVLDSVAAHTAGAAQFDDLTLVVVQRRAGNLETPESVGSDQSPGPPPG